MENHADIMENIIDNESKIVMHNDKRCKENQIEIIDSLPKIKIEKGITTPYELGNKNCVPEACPPKSDLEFTPVNNCCVSSPLLLHSREYITSSKRDASEILGPAPYMPRSSYIPSKQNLSNSSSFPTNFTTITSSESYNYTFNTMGSIGVIFLLFCIAVALDKTVIVYVHVGSLVSIVIINNVYCANFGSIKNLAMSPSLVLPSDKTRFVLQTDKVEL